jgi:negative regulator of flagellin synthesis FlgM
MSPIEIGASRPVGPVQVNTARPGKASEVATETAAVNGATDAGVAAQVEKSSALDAGQAAPVDAERVKDIRHAIETGKYPIIPAKIADAMIAAGMLLRTAQ